MNDLLDWIQRRFLPTLRALFRALWRAAALLSFPLFALAAAPAQSLTSLETGRMPSLPESDSISTLAPVGDRVLAFGAQSTWLLDSRLDQWRRIEWRPQEPVAGAAIYGQQAFLFSGADAVERVERVTFEADEPRPSPLPLLPAALTSVHGAAENERLFVAGVDAAGALRLFELDLAATPAIWASHAPPPADIGTPTSVVAQNASVWITFTRVAQQSEQLWQWQAGQGWTERGATAGRLIPGSARAVGQAHLMYLFRGDAPIQAPPSFMTFHTITGAWASLGEVDAGAAHIAAPWRNGVMWLAQSAPEEGVRASFAQIESTELLLRPFDWAVIIVYLAGMSGVGLYFYLREKRQSTADFFVGSRSIPFWAAGVSLYATNTSSISYIAIPAKSFETNWQYLTNNLVAVCGLMFVAAWIVPLLRRLDLMSVFHYLEIRFHPLIRTLASALCIAVQIGSRLSVVLFLPALAIATITGIDVVWAILIMGAITIAYTALGGMKAVIWTDFVQLFVMFGGALFAIGFIAFSLNGGASEFFAIAAAENKMKLFDWSWDLTEATVWGFIFLVLFDVVLTFPKDQVLMQRVLSTKSAKQAGRSIWTFAAIMIPGGFMFYFIGTALYAYYKTHPERMNPLLTIDETFPLFIAAELPVGVTGLIIAGILAASMSTLSSIMNSVATLASVDFYERIVKQPDQKRSVRFAEAMTVVTGLIGMALAYLLSRYDIHSLFDVSIELAGLLGGGFAGAYTLGMFTRRANWQGVAIGIAAAIALTTIAWSMDLVHPYFYLAISILVCIAVGYLASLFFPPPAQSLAGLTIHEAKPSEDVAPALASAGQ